MPGRNITAAEAALLLGKWASVTIGPRCVPNAEALDFTLDKACDRFLHILAKRPWQSLDDASREILLLAWARVLFLREAAADEPLKVVASIGIRATNTTLLQVLILHYLAPTRLPEEWRARLSQHLPGRLSIPRQQLH